MAGYPVDVGVLADGLLDGPGCTALPHPVPGPGLGLVQIGTWEEEAHHPGPLYLDLDPRRLRAGRLDLLFANAHLGPARTLGATLSAWQTSGGSAAHRTALEGLWSEGQRCAAVAVQLAAYRSAVNGDLLAAYSSEDVRALLQAAVDADPYSAALHYQRYRRFKGAYGETATAQLALPLLQCHAWTRGEATADSIETVLGVTASFQPAPFGDLGALAADFTLPARRLAVDSTTDPELALRLAVDWAYDTASTDTELSLLGAVADRSSEPIWSRLVAFR